MPALPAVDKTFKVQCLWGRGSDTSLYTTQYWLYSGLAATDADAAAFAQAVYTAWAAEKALWSSDVSLDHVIVTDLSSDTAAQGEYSAVTFGTGGTDQVPGGTSLLVNYAVNRRYRGGKPRNYLPWGTATDIATPQTWVSTFVEACTTAINTIISSITAFSNGDISIESFLAISYYEGFTVETNPRTERPKVIPTPRAEPLKMTISGWTVSGVPASQRRRTRLK